ncbi:MAG: holo-ACP synthase [Caldilineaceae bacterium]
MSSAETTHPAPPVSLRPGVILRTGVDLVEIARLRAAIERHGERFLARVYTAAERAVCEGRAESLAGRFAAKEAVAKTLGSGIWRDGVAWTEIEVLRAPSGEPLLALHGAAAARALRLGMSGWSLSLTHDRTHALAFVVAFAALSPSAAS